MNRITTVSFANAVVRICAMCQCFVMPMTSTTAVHFLQYHGYSDEGGDAFICHHLLMHTVVL